MDPGLADILASVERAHNAATALDEGETRRHDLQLLTQAWVSERVTPELLPYPTALMDRTMDRIRRQIETIEDSTARMDAGTSFGLIVIQTELERFKFLVRSFLRTRIVKIDAHPLHILGLHHPDFASQPHTQRNTQPTSDEPLLSPSEASYAETHIALLEKHYMSSFLSSFPPKLRRMDDRAGAGGVSMVEGPDLDKAVFVRCLGVKRMHSGQARRTRNAGFEGEDDDDKEDERADDYEDVEVSCGFTSASPGSSIDESVRENMRGVREERTERMRRGDIWIVRWRGVREAVARGECELI